MRLVSEVRQHFTRRLPEWLLSVHLACYGGQLIRDPNQTLSVVASSSLQHIMSEQQWGEVAVLLSGFWLVALILNGSFQCFARWSKRIRSISAFLVSGFWIVISLGAFVNNSHSTAFVNVCGYAVLAFITSLMTAREAGAADRKAQNGRRG